MPEISKRYTFEQLSTFKPDTIQPQRYSYADLSKPRTPLEDSFLDDTRRYRLCHCWILNAC